MAQRRIQTSYRKTTQTAGTILAIKVVQSVTIGLINTEMEKNMVFLVEIKMELLT